MGKRGDEDELDSVGDFAGGSGGTGGRSIRSNKGETALSSGEPTVARLPQVLPGDDPASLPPPPTSTPCPCRDPPESTRDSPKLSGDLDPTANPFCNVDILAVPFSRWTKLLGPEMTPLLILGDLLPPAPAAFPGCCCPPATAFMLPEEISSLFRFPAFLSSPRPPGPSPERDLFPPPNHPNPFHPDPELPL